MIFTSYSQLYSIKKPAIYETVFYQQKAKIDDLSSIKQDLEAKVASLKTTIDQTSDRLLRCPLTGLYQWSYWLESSPKFNDYLWRFWSI